MRRKWIGVALITILIAPVIYFTWTVAINIWNIHHVVTEMDREVSVPIHQSPTLSSKTVDLFRELGVESDTDTGIQVGAELHSNNSNIQKLVRDGADVNGVTRSGYSPLMIAIMSGDYAAVKVLISCNADVNFSGPSGTTPLLLATRASDTTMVRILLDHNADINRRDRAGMSPLIWAVIKRADAKVRLLLDRHCDVNLLDNDNKTALTWAMSMQPQSADIVKMLQHAGGKLK